MTTNAKLIITPKTKILELIEAYPQLENVLVEFAPAFKNLKNPVLRRTVAKVASLQQAAAIGNVAVGTLVNRLRKEVGQDLFSGGTDTTYNTTQPAWFNADKVVTVFDARDMLAAGEQPVNRVIADLAAMKENEIYSLLAPFLPAPLIDKALSLNIQHWVAKTDGDEVTVYFFKAETPRTTER